MQRGARRRSLAASLPRTLPDSRQHLLREQHLEGGEGRGGEGRGRGGEGRGGGGEVRGGKGREGTNAGQEQRLTYWEELCVLDRCVNSAKGVVVICVIMLTSEGQSRSRSSSMLPASHEDT